jgi:hypothetical protein
MNRFVIALEVGRLVFETLSRFREDVRLGWLGCML